MNKSEIIKILKKTSEELGDILALPQKNDGKTSEILNIGRYWYDDRTTHRNGEFDCATETESGYEIYEVKFLSTPLSLPQCTEEAQIIRQIPDFKPSRIGFISIEGFDFTSKNYELISADSMY